MSVLAIPEHRRGEVRDVSYELITAGRELADDLGCELHLGVISGPVDEYASNLNRTGVDYIHTVDQGQEYNHSVYLQAVEQLWDAVEPSVILIPNTVNGLDYAPALATRLDVPLVTDAVDLTNTDRIAVTREMYGSKVETTVELDVPAVVTVRDTEWTKTETRSDADVTAFDADIDDARVGVTTTGFKEVAAGDVDISEAEFIVSIGRGIEDEDNLSLIEDLCDVTSATLAASRPIVDNDWLDKSRQVGQSGKVVTPDVYIAIGISGAVQHVAGMKGSDTIIAINTDPSAPIFDIADYGIVGDLFDVVPTLIEEFE